MSSATSTTKRHQLILDRINGLISEAIPGSENGIDPHLPFLEMGANSLVLMDVQRTIKSEFGIEIAIGQFFEELTNIDILVHYIDQHTPKEKAQEQAQEIEVIKPDMPVQMRQLVSEHTSNHSLKSFQAPTSLGIQHKVTSSEIEAIFSAQLEATSRALNDLIQQQLAWVSGTRTQAPSTSNGAPTSQKPPQSNVQQEQKEPTSTPASADRPVSAIQPQKMLSALETRARGLSPTQQAHLEDLIKNYNKKTISSKHHTQQYRPVLADSRAAIGFRFTTKEMLYPIVSNRSRGARIWDIDGNEYIDISMGQGVSMFGHHPEFIESELKKMVETGVEMGPRPDTVGEVAELICEMTGFDRVTFTNSGTEAVMAAMRLARAATKRDKIVSFEGAWHGHADSVMGMRVEEIDGVPTTKPVSPGTPAGAVADQWVLPFNDPASLDFIRRHASSIAAVMVEPVQSRNPKVQPKEFLHELRRITSESGSLLLFDEMITGFRTHPQGAQGWFGIKADMATYGKVIGGGLPIGVVAGRADLMDPIDGGMWDYGDTSYPLINRVVFGGTFCQHPLAMTASLATLKYLKAQGQSLQNDLNTKTARFAETLNAWFTQEQVPIQIAWFGSLFRFEFSSNFELLFYHMNLRGVFVWEWRNCFLSTAHTQEDLDRVIQVVKESVLAMREGGFIPPKPTDVSTGEGLNRGTSASLSLAQKQLATLSQIQPEGSKAYHISTTLDLKGEVDIPALSKAMDQIVSRHDALRSTIEGTDTIHIQPHLSGYFSWVDFSTQKDPVLAFKKWHEEQAHIPFEIHTGPLFRVNLVRMDASSSLLWIRGHHMILDGLSLNLIVHELAVLYNAALSNAESSLSQPLSCLEHNRWLENQSFEKQESYWHKQFDGQYPVLALPSDRPEPLIKSYRGGRITREIDERLATSIKKYSTANQATHFMTWFAVYALWLHRLSNQEEVVVGMPVAGRSMNGSDDAVGYFTHLIPIRSTLHSTSESFPEYLRRMRGQLLRGYEHQDYPFSRLLEHLKNKTHSSSGNLVRAVFNLDRPGEVPAFKGLDVEWTSQPIFHTAFDIVMNLTEVGDRLTLECDYSIDRFNRDRIEQYLDAFIALATAVSDQDPSSVTEIPMTGTNELDKYFTQDEYTHHRLEHGETILAWLRSSFLSHDDKIALEWTHNGIQESMKYADLGQKVDGFTAFLQKKGINKGDRIAICLDRSPELVILILASMQAGAVFVPMDPSYPAERLQFMTEDCQAKMLVTHSHLTARFGKRTKNKALIISVDEISDEVSTRKGKAKKVTIDGDDPAYMIYTSGSTGVPKGVLIRHKGLSNYLHWATEYYKTHEGEGILLHSPVAFDATLTSLFCPLLSGNLVCIVPESDNAIEVLLKYLTGEYARDWSLLKVTTSHLDLLTAMIPDVAKSKITRCFVLGGEALFSHNIKPWLEHAPNTRIINEYGPTETVVGCCIYEPKSSTDADGPIPIGRPIWNTQLYVLDHDGRPLAPGLEGELYVAGLGVGLGYWNREDLTAERFKTTSDLRLHEISPKKDAVPIYRTGDRVRMQADGQLVFLGRIDQQIKLRGYRIEPGEIEARIRSIEGVRQAAVFTMNVAEQENLVAAVESSGMTLMESKIRTQLHESLPSYMVPTHIVLLDQIPLNQHGKMDMNSLLDRVKHVKQEQTSAAQTQSFNSNEAKIAAIWSELLGHQQFSSSSNFFEVGGHSMLVLPLKERLSELFSRTVTPVDIFRYPSIALLGKWLSDSPPAKSMTTTSATSERKNRNTASFKPLSKPS